MADTVSQVATTTTTTTDGSTTTIESTHASTSFNSSTIFLDNGSTSHLVPNKTTPAPSSSEHRELLKRVFWNGGSPFDAWLNAASFQVSQVLLNLPFTFAQMGMASGIIYQLCYGLMGCWVSYLMTSLYLIYRQKFPPSSNNKKHVVQWYEVIDGLLGRWFMLFTLGILLLGLSSAGTLQILSCASAAYYINDNLDKRTWTLVFAPLLFLGLLIPTPRNYRMWSFIGIVMTSYVAWYLTIAAAVHGQEEGVKHTGPHTMQNYFTGLSNILYTFGGHGLTVELAGSMWEPKKYKFVYFYAVLYVFTLTLPSATTVYWAFGDKMLHNANALAVLPRTKYRDAAVVLIILHQLFEFGMVALPVCFMFEKLIGIHQTKHYILKVLARVPVFLFMWFCALLMPFFGPIDSINGSFFTAVGVYITPCLAHMLVFRSAAARKNSIEQPPFWLPSWTGVFCINFGIILWVMVVGVGLGGWATISNLTKLVQQFGFFAKCYQCTGKTR